jgi:glycine cleavage system H protein
VALDPKTLLYAKTHEWVRVEGAAGQKAATVGLSDFALKALTDLVYLNLPEVGRQVQAGQPLGEIESVKAVSDIYCPVDGEIVEANQPIAQNLETLAQDPYGAGWLVKIRVTDDSAFAQLLDYTAYQKQCEEEGEDQG